MMPETVERKFVMHGARGAIDSGLEHISAQVDALEGAIEENPALAFDLAKTLVESTCKTILADRSISYSNDDDLPKLFKSVSNSLPFLPPSESANINARNSLRQTLGGLSTAVQGICELRNSCGFASHGSEGPRPQLEAVQAMLAAEAADTIVGFFYRVHRQGSAAPSPETLVLQNDPEFDAYIDDLHPKVTIFREDFASSRILFDLAPEPYRLYLAEYKQDKAEEEKETGAEANNAQEAENA
jgi:hypothetical protein